MRSILFFTITTVSMLFSAYAGAQSPIDNYPTRPIQAIIPFPAGNTSDILGRIVLSRVEAILGQPIVIDNRGGASGTLAGRAAAEAAPDGYTIFYATQLPAAMAVALFDNLPYDPLTDFEPVARLHNGALMLAVNDGFPVQDMSEFLDHVRDNPGRFSYASTGSGTAGNITMESLKYAAGLDIRHIPYSSATQALADLANGDVQMMFYTGTAFLPFVQEGRVRVLATANGERFPNQPDIPTVSERGLEGFSEIGWHAVLVPAGTPREIVDRLDEVLREVIEDPEVQALLLSSGNNLPFYLGPDETGEFIRSEIERYQELVEATGLSLQ